MHTAFDIKSTMFEVSIGGRNGSREDALPWSERDRLGVVIDQPVGALGAGLLILLAITAFYDMPQKKRRMRPLYPDIFLIHFGGPWGPFTAFDFWPDHKEIFTSKDPRQILRTINNLGITHLVIPDNPRIPVAHRFKEPEAACDRIKRCYAYSPTGAVDDFDLAITARATYPGKL